MFLLKKPTLIPHYLHYSAWHSRLFPIRSLHAHLAVAPLPTHMCTHRHTHVHTQTRTCAHTDTHTILHPPWCSHIPRTPHSSSNLGSLLKSFPPPGTPYSSFLLFRSFSFSKTPPAGRLHPSLQAKGVLPPLDLFSFLKTEV